MAIVTKANMQARDQPYGHDDRHQKLKFIQETMMINVATKANIDTRDQPYGYDDRRHFKTRS